MSNTTPASSATADEPIAWRFIPLRPPRFLHALLVTIIALGVAMGLRVSVVGFPQGLGASSTVALDAAVETTARRYVDG